MCDIIFSHVTPLFTNCLIIDLFHSGHVGRTSRKNTGVPNDADEGSVPFRSNRAKELLLCLLAPFNDSATLNGI